MTKIPENIYLSLCTYQIGPDATANPEWSTRSTVIVQAWFTPRRQGFVGRFSWFPTYVTWGGKVAMPVSPLCFLYLHGTSRSTQTPQDSPFYIGPLEISLKKGDTPLASEQKTTTIFVWLSHCISEGSSSSLWNWSDVLLQSTCSVTFYFIFFSHVLTPLNQSTSHLLSLARFLYSSLMSCRFFFPKS